MRDEYVDTVMSTISLHRFPEDIHPSDAGDLIQELLLAMELQATHGTFTEIGKTKGKTIKYDNKFRERVKSFKIGEISSLYAERYFDSNDRYDCSLAVGINLIGKTKSLEIHCKNEDYAFHDAFKLNDIFLKYITPAYGFGYSMRLRQGPRWFRVGIGYSSMDKENFRQSTAFRREYMFGNEMENGMIRDVYQWNYITEPHLTKQIEGKPLVEWLKESREKVHYSKNGGVVWEIDLEKIEIYRSIFRLNGFTIYKPLKT